MSGSSSGLGRLAALLGALDPLGAPSTPREIAELIWLGQHLPEAAMTGRFGQESRGLAHRKGADLPLGHSSDGTASGAAAAEGVRLYLPEGGLPEGDREGGLRAAPMRVTGAAVLPRRRTLVRALRPFKRRVPSRTRTVLDEDATADAVARDERWRPVLVPAKDRWFGVNLIIDACGDCAGLWSPLGRALQGALQELGAFREVRIHWLRCRADGTAALAVGTPRYGPLRSPASCVDPTGRTVTLVLTDGVAPFWQTPGLLSALRQWATTGPAAILQTLPDHLWDRTALAPEPGRLRNLVAGAPNSRMLFSPYALGSRPLRPDEVPLPVLGIEPGWLAPWALAVAGAGEFDGSAVVLRARPAGAEAPAGLRGPGARPPVSFEEFLAQTEPRVFRLAAYLSAAPLNLPVMRLIQSAMLPGSPPSDLAEIIFSGLLHQVPRGQADNLDPSYDFAPGVRHRLLSTLRRDEADAVISAVSTYITENTGDAAGRFTAAVPDSAGSVQLSPKAQHWASVRTAVRRRQGRFSAVDDSGLEPRPEEVGRQRVLTADVPWSRFDPAEYVDDNYPIIPDLNAEVLVSVRNYFVDFFSAHSRLPFEGVSVGAGANIYPAMLMLPWCASITLLENSPENVQYLRSQLSGYDPAWGNYWDAISQNSAEYSVLGTNPRLRFSETVQIVKGGLADLRNSTARWDVGILSFAGDSSPAPLHAFRQDVQSFMTALRPGAVFAAIFMHPSPPHAEEELRAVFAGLTDALSVVRFGDTGGNEALLDAPIVACGLARGVRVSTPPRFLVDALDAVPSLDEPEMLRECARQVGRALGTMINLAEPVRRRASLLLLLRAVMPYPEGLQMLGSTLELIEGDTSAMARVKTAIAVVEAPLFPPETWERLMALLQGLEVRDIAGAFNQALRGRLTPLPAHCTEPWMAVLYAATLNARTGELLPCVLLVEHLAQYAKGRQRQELFDWAQEHR